MPSQFSLQIVLAALLFLNLELFVFFLIKLSFATARFRFCFTAICFLLINCYFHKHFQTNKLQSCPPALTTYLSPLVNFMLVIWVEWPKYFLCFANFSVQGKSKSFTMPKSSPVTMLSPEWDTQAQFTSALSRFRDQIPMTSSPRILQQWKLVITITLY